MTPESFEQSVIGQQMKATYGWDVETWRVIAKWLRDMQDNLLGVRSTHRRAKIIREAKVDLAQRFGATWEVFRAEQLEWEIEQIKRCERWEERQVTRPISGDEGPPEPKWFSDLVYAAHVMAALQEPATAQEATR